MRSLLRHQAPAVVLAVLAACAVVIALLADHLAWPMVPAFPWLHGGDFSYVATKRQWELAHTARTIAGGQRGSLCCSSSRRSVRRSRDVGAAERAFSPTGAEPGRIATRRCAVRRAGRSWT
ncbi:hypothetical protein P9139_21410 [Curtobacterium flaccumfaciens]|nr:hypothetical protein P9139_21410 [Curtobacterium flaccumfaciens]